MKAPARQTRATVISFGVRLELRSDSPQMMRRLLKRLPPGWKKTRARSVDRVFTIPGSAGDDARRALDRFEREVKLFVAETARGRVFVHAGAVGWHGRAVIVPGLTLSGKSTLVAALVSAGATYYSDEYTVLDARGRVHPYPRALSLRDPKSRSQTPQSIRKLGGRIGRAPLPVAAIVVTRYRRGERWRPQRTTPGQGLLALLANTVSARRDFQRALGALRQAVANAVVFEGSRGEASTTARSILGELRKITKPQARGRRP